MVEREHFTNGRCFTFATGLALAGSAFGAQVSGWSHWVTIGACYGVGIVVMLLSTVLIAKSYFSSQSGNTTTASQTSGVIPGIPTLSALLEQNPSVEFDAKKFFAQAYYSPITAEIEKNIKVIAQQNSPNDKEAFYARFIGIGAIAYQYDVSWFTIFGSQLRALEETNSRGLIPVTDLKKHYEKAVVDYPKTFEDYSFDQWLGFMKSRMLIAVYPSQMVELSWGGKDFLKYLAHMAWNTKEKPN
jgi:hypothetical protein